MKEGEGKDVAAKISKEKQRASKNTKIKNATHLFPDRSIA